MHASLQQAKHINNRNTPFPITLTSVLPRTRVSGAALRLVATAAGAGESRRRMAEAAVSCSYTDLEDGIKRYASLSSVY
jgi:hypothetical protein